MLKNSYFILAIAILLAIITRFYLLGEAPHGLYLDEAGQGYSAYSLLLTGKDEFGMPYPFVFRSFTDFKTPVYIYLITPLIPLFGLTKFTVRFPSFFFSILTLPVLYFLIIEITPKKYARKLAATTALLLSISPWHILFGRTNFECNVALFFFLAGCLAFYTSFNNKKLLILAGVLFAIAIPSYHAQRLVTPLMGLMLLIRYRQKIFTKSNKNYILIGGLLALIISLPTLSVATTPGFLARASGLNIFSRGAVGIIDYNRPLAFLLNSKIFLATREFSSLYASYFSPRNMFLLGDYDPRSSFPGLTTFFVWQFPFYIYGLYILIKDKNLKELRFFTIAFLLIGPLPAAVTRDPYSSIRSLQLVIPQTICISIGIIYFYKFIKNKKLFMFTFYLSAVALIIYSLLKLYSSVIILNEYYRARDWNYGWEEVVKALDSLDPKVPVIIDIARNEPYIQILFFKKFDPIQYQNENFEVSNSDYYSNMNRLDVRKIGNITTKHINWETDLNQEAYLVGDELAISDDQIKSHNLELIDEILYPDGSVAYKIVKNN